MLISRLFIRHKTLAPHFAPLLFIGLIASFAIVGQAKPVIGLVGLGTTLIITGTLVLANRQRIWENYRAGYRKSRGLSGLWTKPSPIYYNINVMFLWPFIVFLGLVCLWAAYGLE